MIVGLTAVLLGLGILAWTVREIGKCSDECHGFVFPLGFCVLLVLAGILAVTGAGVKWKIDRFFKG